MTRNNILSRTLPLIIIISAQSFFTSDSVAKETQGVSAKTILEKSDNIRFPKQDFQVNVRITSSKTDRKPDIKKYQIVSKGNENSLVITTAPASEKGQILLMKRRNLWVYLPNISQPVRLPLSQRLTGQVANGDLARANFLGDYEPTLLRAETVKGKKHYVLGLEANDRSVTYRKVTLWVNQSNFRPYKAEFYTISGRLMKTAYYENFKKMADEMRPTRLVMIDALRKGEQSLLEYSNMQIRDLPEKMFTKNYLKKLQ